MQERFFSGKRAMKKEKRDWKGKREFGSFPPKSCSTRLIIPLFYVTNKKVVTLVLPWRTNETEEKKKRRSHVVRGTFFPLQLNCGRVRFLFKQDFRINISKEQCGKHWQLFCRTRQSSYLWILPRGRPFVHSLPWGTDLPTAHPPDEDHLKRKWNH